MGLQFQYPEYGWLFLLLLPLAGAWAWWEGRKVVLLKKLANPSRLLETLLSNYNPKMARVRFICYSLAFAGMVFAIMNPRVVQERASMPMEGSQVMLAMDVSNSMLATDVAPNRFERARTFAVQLVEALGGNRVGVLAFAGEARLQMPPTGDIGAVEQAIQTLSPQSIPLQGTNIEAALDVAHESLTSDALAYSAVVFITDGEQLEGEALQKAKEYGREGMQVFVAGLGTGEGALLTEPGSANPFLDENGQQVLSKANAGLLQDLAENTGGEYFEVTDIHAAVLQVAKALNRVGKAAAGNSNLVNYYSFAPWILLLVLVFLAWEWVPLRVNLSRFGQKQGAMALGMACIFMIPTGARAQKANASLEKAFQAFREGEFETAALSYEKALELEPNNTEAIFYLAMVALKAGKFEEAAKQFTELAARKPSIETFAASLNNAGLAYAGAKKLPEAISAFKLALKAAPDDAEIRQNLQKAIMDLKEQQKEPPKKNENPQPPMEKEDADRKLQSLMDEERRTREKMKPRAVSSGDGKNW